MSEKKRATCWRNRAEWDYVYKMLYCFEDENNQIKALSIVDVWRSRHCAKLPIAVECTANLIAAKMGLGSTSSKTKSLSIAMALIRFVNGMVDQVQKGIYARSIQSIAEEIGIPDWLVDIRHEATHAALPSDEILETALDVALQWLKDEYWQETYAYMFRNDSDLNTEELLEEFIAIQLSNAKPKEKKNSVGYCLGVLFKQLTDMDTVRKNLLPNMLNLGMLLPTESQLKSLKREDIQSALLAYVILWMPVLNSLNERFESFLPEFITELTENLSNQQPSKTEGKYASLLVMELLKDLSSCQIDEILRDVIMTFCLRFPSQEALKILQFIYHKGFGGDKKLDKAIKLVRLVSKERNIYPNDLVQGLNDLNSVKLNKKAVDYFTKNPIKCVDIAALKSQMALKTTAFENLESWRQMDDLDWGSIPAGKFLNNFNVIDNENEEDVFKGLPFFPMEVDQIYDFEKNESLAPSSREKLYKGAGSHVTSENLIGGDAEDLKSNNQSHGMDNLTHDRDLCFPQKYLEDLSDATNKIILEHIDDITCVPLSPNVIEIF